VVLSLKITVEFGGTVTALASVETTDPPDGAEPADWLAFE
jgi:hypothetical protein